MTLNLLETVEKSIVSNLNSTGIFYYDCDNWHSYTFLELNISAKFIEATLSHIVAEKWTNILFYIKTSPIYPALVLGAMRKGFGFTCVEAGGKDLLLDDYVSTLGINYIISSCDINDEVSCINFTCEKRTCIFGEEIFFWVSDDKVYRNEVPQFMYAIRTSGTTGTSKYVRVLESSIFPNIKDFSEILQVKPSDKILLMTPLTFDPSVVELFLALSNGCSMTILPKSVLRDPRKLQGVLFPKMSGGGFVTILQTTPSILKRWNADVLRDCIFHKESSLRAVLLGGEEFPSIEEIKSWNVNKHISIYNLYGVTEVSCWAAISRVLPTKNPDTHIGDPLSETILELRSTTDENEGELYIGSRTRKCFVGSEVENQFDDTDILFRPTGDIFKKMNGKLYFLGRADDFVKRWGNRVSLSEVEKAGRLYENVADCCCVEVKFESHHRLVLFVVEQHGLSLPGLREFLKGRLSQSSWPDEIRSISAFPLTNHGKTCKTSLKRMAVVLKESSFEQAFNELWDTYTRDVSFDKDFISAGGDSFSALQFFSEMKSRFPCLPDLFLGMLMQNKSRGELLNHLQSLRGNTSDVELGDEHLSFITQTSVPSDTTGASQFTKIDGLYSKGKYTSEGIDGDRDIKSERIEIRPLWKYDHGKCVDASPLGVCFSGGACLTIVGSHSGRILVIDLMKGDVISTCTLPDRIESSACISCDASSYYIGCYDYCMYCIGLQSGSVIWKFLTGDMIKSTAIENNEKIIFGSYDSHAYCLDKTGRKQWRTKLKSPILAEGVVSHENLFLGTLGSIAILTLDTGTLVKEVASQPVFSNPLLSLGRLVVADVRGKVSWLNPETLEVENSFSACDHIFSSLVKSVSKEGVEMIIFGCSDSCVYCLRDRALFWKVSLDSKVIATPFIRTSNDPKSGGIVCCASSTGNIHLLDLSTGRKLGNFPLGGEVYSSPIIVNNKIIVGCRDNNVYVLDIFEKGSD